jgi:hypothetical protein
VLLQALLIYVVAGLLSYTQSFILAGTVQRPCRSCAATSDKLNRLPSRTSTASRVATSEWVTNDIDNVAQSLSRRSA